MGIGISSCDPGASNDTWAEDEAAQAAALESLATKNALGLPRLPLPEVAPTLERLLESCRACSESPEELRALEKAVADFRSGPAERLQARIAANERHAGHPLSWFQQLSDDLHNARRCPAPLDRSPYFGIDERQATGTLACARFALAMCKWSRKVLGGGLDADVPPLCISSMGKLFSSAKIPVSDMDILRQDPRSTNIVIVSGGVVWSVRVYKEGKLLAPEALARVIEDVREAPALPAERALPLITAGDRDMWAKGRGVLLSDARNRAGLELIDSAILVLAVDKAAECTPAAKAKNFLLGDPLSRWWDKHQLILDATGSMAVHFEPSCSDETHWGRLIAECMRDVVGAPPEPYASLPVFETMTEREVHRLRFTIAPSVRRAILGAVEHYTISCVDIDVECLNYRSWGESFASLAGISLDTAVQLAFQITHFRLHGKVGPTYEAVHTRRFFAGRTDAVRSCTLEAREMCQAWKDGAGDLCSLLSAAAKQTGLAKAAALGGGIDNHLRTLQAFAEASGEEVPLFCDLLFLRAREWVMATSNGTAPYVGSFGVTPMHPQGYGMGYTLGPSSINVVCAVHASHTAGAKAFVSALAVVLDDMKAVLGKRAVQLADPASPAKAKNHPSLLGSELTGSKRLKAP